MKCADSAVVIICDVLRRWLIDGFLTKHGLEKPTVSQSNQNRLTIFLRFLLLLATETHNFCIQNCPLSSTSWEFMQERVEMDSYFPGPSAFPANSYATSGLYTRTSIQNSGG